mmetsp:Transcript_22893/g.61424  ORF Transcript_22893/g.61424 Transcript_22893/m.61424 type:complete len:247 (-) Transcript_22893:114-854(-)
MATSAVAPSRSPVRRHPPRCAPCGATPAGWQTSPCSPHRTARCVARRPVASPTAHRKRRCRAHPARAHVTRSRRRRRPRSYAPARPPPPPTSRSLRCQSRRARPCQRRHRNRVRWRPKAAAGPSRPRTADECHGRRRARELVPQRPRSSRTLSGHASPHQTSSAASRRCPCPEPARARRAAEQTLPRTARSRSSRSTTRRHRPAAHPLQQHQHRRTWSPSTPWCHTCSPCWAPKRRAAAPARERRQ